MFIYKEEPKNKEQKKTYSHPLDNTDVRFMKYAGKLFVNVYDYLNPFPNSKEMFTSVKKALPLKWKNDLRKVWMNTEDFSVVQKAIRKNMNPNKVK